MQDSQTDFRWVRHFTPNGIHKPADSFMDRANNPLLFGYGMMSLVDWWKNTEDWHSLGFPRLNIVQGIPGNDPMNRLLERLLGPKDIDGFHRIKLDELVHNEQSLKRLERLKNRCLQRQLTMNFPIGPIPDYSR